MKKFIIASCILATVCGTASAQFNLGNLLGGGSNGSGSTNVGDLINTVTSIVGDNQVEISQIAGTWKYYSPAVTFNSDNLLQKAGGAAASTAIENKLKPYYSKVGVTSTVFTFQEDGTFTCSIGKLKCDGTVTKNEDGSFAFNFTALGKIPAGNLTGYIQRKGSNITITIDATKLMNLLSKVAAFSGNSTLKGVSSLLDSYEGMNIGAQFSKQ